MIYIDVEEKKWRELEEYHKEYLVKTVPQNWERVLGSGISPQDGQVLRDLFEKCKIMIPGSKEGEGEKRKKLSRIIELCTSDSIDKEAETDREKLFEGIRVNDAEGSENEVNEEQKQKCIRYLLKVFGYDRFSNSSIVMMKNGKPWNRHSFMDELGIKVCPYCNRQYITSYWIDDGNEKKKIRTTTDTDHYYPKTEFPLLSMNIHNMIPSCQICNSRMKLDKVHSAKDCHLYPYKDRSDSLGFEIELEKLEQLYNFSEQDICIKLRVPAGSGAAGRARNSKSIFRLEEVYEAHKDEVFRLVEYMKQYSLKGYRKIFCENYPGFCGGYGEFLTILYPFLHEEERNVPLVKMKTDIYRFIEGKLLAGEEYGEK